MEKADKIAFTVISVPFGAIIVGIMWLIKLFGIEVLGWFQEADSGIGFKSSLIISSIISSCLIILFALVAGDGVLGELPAMVLSFFAFTIFFMLSIAWIF